MKRATRESTLQTIFLTGQTLETCSVQDLSKLPLQDIIFGFDFVLILTLELLVFDCFVFLRRGFKAKSLPNLDSLRSLNFVSPTYKLTVQF